MTEKKARESLLFLEPSESTSQFLERRLATLFGLNSKAFLALDLVKSEMCVEKGFKRDNGSDYYVHCIHVANTLISFGITDEDVICAALLHDIIEDVEGYSEVTIEKLFNKNVARLVMLVTKKHGVDYKKPKNLKSYISNISQDMNAAAIKTADRMHNMLTLEEKNYEARYRKVMETKNYYMPFLRKCRVIYPRYENLFYAASTEMEPLIFHIESMYSEIRRLENEIEKLKKAANN